MAEHPSFQPANGMTPSLRPIESIRKERRLLVWRILILSMVTLLAFSVLLNWIPLFLPLSGFLLWGLIAFICKFRRDNRQLIAGVTKKRFFLSAVSGFLRFIPGLMILSVAFGIVWGCDFVINQGMDWAMRWADSAEIIKYTQPKVYDRHPWSPWRMVGSKTWLGSEQLEFREEKSEAIKFLVRTTINFLKLLSFYPWMMLGYLTLRFYFFFWGRAFVANGGRVTMEFPRYRV